MMFWDYGYGWPMMFGMFWGLLCTVLLVIAIWALIRWAGRSAGGDTRTRMPSTEVSAMEILRQRYARGEIDAETFEQMRGRLEASRERQPIGGR